MTPEETDGAPAEAPAILVRKRGDLPLQVLKQRVEIPQNLVSSHDDREDVKPVIDLTPEQWHAIIQQRADKIPLKTLPLEKLRCLASGQGSQDCDD